MYHLFWKNIAIYSSLGLYENRPSYIYRRSLQPSKNVQNFQEDFLQIPQFTPIRAQLSSLCLQHIFFPFFIWQSMIRSVSFRSNINWQMLPTQTEPSRDPSMYIAKVKKNVKSNISEQIIPPSKHPTIPYIRVDKNHSLQRFKSFIN